MINLNQIFGPSKEISESKTTFPQKLSCEGKGQNSFYKKKWITYFLLFWKTWLAKHWYSCKHRRNKINFQIKNNCLQKLNEIHTFKLKLNVLNKSKQEKLN